MPRLNRLWVANLNGVGGLFFRHLFTNKAQYRRAGLDGREARVGWRAAARTATRSRCSGSRRWPRSSRRSG